MTDTEPPRRPGKGILIRDITFIVLIFVVFISISIIHHQPGPSQHVAAQANQGAVTIPGVTGYSYTPGLADQFRALDADQLCQKWQGLPESEKHGLAFVAPTVVPSCAEGRYIQQAGEARAGRLHKQYRWESHAEYFDLGTPPFASYYIPESYDRQRYTCTYLTKLVSARKYVTDPMPKPKDPYVETAAYRKAFNKWESEEEWVDQIFDLYASGGKFDPGCYPPGAVFGKDDSITFYPNHPVKSISETPAAVFTGSSHCNICFRGPVYQVKKDDTLGKIATCFYGNQGDSYQIQWNNNLKARDLLQIGQKLHIPDKKHLDHCVKPYG